MMRVTTLSKKGFSLIELLVVIAVVALLTSVSMVAVGGNQARKLASNGNLIADLSKQARQNSISKGVLTALVLCKTYPNNQELNNRLLVLMELSPDSTTWRQLTKWQILPQGGVVDSSQSDSFISQVPNVETPISNLKYLGATVTDIAFQVFLPDGSLATKKQSSSGSVIMQPPVLSLSQGNINSRGDLVKTSSVNYYKITFNLHTGMTKIECP